MLSPKYSQLTSKPSLVLSLGSCSPKMTEHRVRTHLPTPKALGQFGFFEDNSVPTASNKHDPVTIPPSSSLPSAHPPRKLSYPIKLPDFVVGSIPHFVPVPWPNAMIHAPMTPDFITSLEKRSFLSGTNGSSEDEDGMVFDMEDPTSS